MATDWEVLLFSGFSFCYRLDFTVSYDDGLYIVIKNFDLCIYAVLFYMRNSTTFLPLPHCLDKQLVDTNLSVFVRSFSCYIDYTKSAFTLARN